MSSDKFSRIELKCPKCGSKWMQEKHVREMFISPYKGHQPLYSGATKLWVMCADCGTLTWKEGMDLRPKIEEAGNA